MFWMLMCVVFARFFAIFSLCFAVKLIGLGLYELGARKRIKWDLSYRAQGLLGLGGIIRGAIAWAQVLQIDKSTSPEQEVLVTTTLGVVLISTCVFGALTPPTIAWLGFAPETMDLAGEVRDIIACVCMCHAHSVSSLLDPPARLPACPLLLACLPACLPSLLLHRPSVTTTPAVATAQL